MKICAIIVYFHGDIDKIIDNLKTYIPYVDQLIIWLNSPMSRARDIEDTFSHTNIKILGDGVNIGISKALNQILNDIDSSFDYLLTMDQDSKWENFKEYIETIKSHLEHDVNVLAYGPRIVIQDAPISKPLDTIVDVETLITSGTLVKLSYLKAIGGYCEELWVDGVDEELCYRAKEKGYEIKKIQSAYLIQQYGSGKKIKILNHVIINPEYNESRKYNIAKNHIYIIKKYKLGRKTKRTIIMNYIVIPLFFALIYENEKKKKCKAIYRGVIDGIKWKVQ